MTTTKTVSAHGYRTEPEWLTDQAHSPWHTLGQGLLYVAQIGCVCLVPTAIVVLAIAVKG
jgi:hypothetical protein